MNSTLEGLRAELAHTSLRLREIAGDTKIVRLIVACDLAADHLDKGVAAINEKIEAVEIAAVAAEDRK